MASIIDGKSIAAELRRGVAAEVAAMAHKPGLAVILVGDDPASHVYVGNKIKASKEVGIESFERRLPADAAQEDVRKAIKELNADPNVHGILLQLPTPDHLDSDELIQLIDPRKDVDGLTLPNIGRLVAGLDGLVPCTPQGSLILIKEAVRNLIPHPPALRAGPSLSLKGEGFILEGMNAVVIGRSLLFGKPMAQLLLAENCTVTTAHSKTRNLDAVCRNADILVAAVGRAKMVKGDWVKPGAIVIDVGINRMEDGKLCGDVDYAEASKVAGAITPVPGGVGPMTIACLLRNTVKAARSEE